MEQFWGACLWQLSSDRLSRTSFWKMADIVCMGLLSGQIIGVWGNFFNREAFGEYTDSLFAMGLPMDSVQKSAVTKLMKQHLVTFRDMDYIQVHPLFSMKVSGVCCCF